MILWKAHLTSALDRPLRNAVDRLSQIRKRKQTNKPVMFSELMTASASAETEQRAWRQTLTQGLDRVMETHRQMQESEHSTMAEVLKVLWYQSDMLGHLVALHERRQNTVPLQPLHNAPELRAMLPSISPTTMRSCGRLSRMQPLLSSTPASCHPTPGDSE